MTQRDSVPTMAILAPEDESILAIDLENTLTAGGFSVVVVSNGTEAIKYLDENFANLEALVTDIQLGVGPNGWEVGHHARRLNGGLPVVYVSADSGHNWEAEGVPSSVFIHKPYAPALIVTAVSMLINQRS